MDDCITAPGAFGVRIEVEPGPGTARLPRRRKQKRSLGQGLTVTEYRAYVAQLYERGGCFACVHSERLSDGAYTCMKGERWPACRSSQFEDKDE